MYYIVIDQSTSGTKALLFKDGKICSRIDKKHQQFYPQNKWVEHNAHEIISNVEFLIEEIIRKNGLKYRDINSISLTNQRETSVAWKKSSGRPIYNAIVWQCQRTSDYCEQMQEHNQRVNELTGLRIDNYFSGPKYNWIMNNVKEAKELAKANDLCLGTIESWLIFNLTAKQNHFTDVTNASRTLLMDINTNTWNQELCNIFDIDISTLPAIKLPSDEFGTYNGIPIKGVMADSQAALFAHQLKPFKELKITMGTGSSIMANVDLTADIRHNSVLTALYQNNGERNQYALEGIIKSFGDTVEFMKNELGFFEDYDQIFEYTFGQTSNSDIVFIPGQHGLGCPYWNDNIGCQIIDLSRNTTRNDIAAAGIKSLLFIVKKVIDEIKTTINFDIKSIKVDGGLSKQPLFLQYLSNLMQMNIEVINVEEASALGALLNVVDIDIEKTTTCSYIPLSLGMQELAEFDAWNKQVSIFIENRK